MALRGIGDGLRSSFCSWSNWAVVGRWCVAASGAGGPEDHARGGSRWLLAAWGRVPTSERGARGGARRPDRYASGDHRRAYRRSGRAEQGGDPAKARSGRVERGGSLAVAAGAYRPRRADRDTAGGQRGAHGVTADAACLRDAGQTRAAGVELDGPVDVERGRPLPDRDTARDQRGADGRAVEPRTVPRARAGSPPPRTARRCGRRPRVADSPSGRGGWRPRERPGPRARPAVSRGSGRRSRPGWLRPRRGPPHRPGLRRRPDGARRPSCGGRRHSGAGSGPGRRCSAAR